MNRCTTCSEEGLCPGFELNTSLSPDMVSSSTSFSASRQSSNAPTPSPTPTPPPQHTMDPALAETSVRLQAQSTSGVSAASSVTLELSSLSLQLKCETFAKCIHTYRAILANISTNLCNEYFLAAVGSNWTAQANLKQSI